MKKRVLVDMDGVLADIYAQFLKFEFDDLKINQPLSALIGKFERDAFQNHDKYIHSEDFFYGAKPMPNSIEVLEKINLTHDLYIVSAAVEFPLSLLEKVKWLNKYFPFISWKQIILCGSKEPITGDVMIDDHFRNLDPFQGQTILFNQPHNLTRDSGRHQRVNDWEEIEALLL